MVLALKNINAIKRNLSDFKNLPNEQLITNPFFIEWTFLNSKEFKTGSDIRLASPVIDTLKKTYDQLLAYRNVCDLITYSLLQYRLMKVEINSIYDDELEPFAELELCLQVTNIYWYLIKEYLIENSFKKTDHEIYFFKVVKPAFISECQVFSLAYHALLFSDFRDKETNRLEI